MRVTLVVNPSSGKGRAQEMLPQVAGRLRDDGIETEILLSRDFDEAIAMTRGAVDGESDVLAVMGGDGMMHLGVNACAGQDRTALALIPAGTGNDLCRGLGLPPFDPVAAAALIAGGKLRRVDLGRINGDRWIGTVTATGFDAMVNHRANLMPWPKGGLRYPLAALAELRVFSPLSFRLTLDGQARDLDAMLIAVGNTSSYGGGMKICPQADPTDGRLDVTVIHPVSRSKLLRLLPQMYSGRFVRDPAVELTRAAEVSVEGPGLVGYGDGELIAAAPLHIRCEPGALGVFVPSIA
ncbi:diacylglycerol/lipid kinase family protein [Microlunatus ginsengisoli]|uniref:Diacylglycerol kinase n=1 Tax=Microlunatus ginsengisoli TaxID=363863 RepID=A0ABP7A373_9ACTN